MKKLVPIIFAVLALVSLIPTSLLGRFRVLISPPLCVITLQGIT